ncbi:MAG TPA: SH3 domain-containing protein [Phenylobacterium sp.]|nr:SH3 domain-containing protein [Phenylobacterium sp.]
MNSLRRAATSALAIALLTPSLALAQARPTNAQQAQTQAMAEIPRCSQRLGTLSIIDGDNPYGWAQYNLAPPAKLLRVIVQRSGCFNLVDRGAGLTAAQTERDIGGNLGLQRGSNMGQGQVRAADYVLVAEVQARDSNAGGSAVAGVVGGLVGGRAGALIGGIRTTKLEANTVLSLTNVRTTETVAVQDGYAVKNDIGWGAGGGWGFAGAVGGGYEDTEIGRIVTLAFMDAYTKLVTDMGGLATGVSAAQAAPSRTFTAQRNVNLRASPDANGRLLRTLPAGATVYPTGKQQELWWEVADENDNVGWVLNTGLAPSR